MNAPNKFGAWLGTLGINSLKKDIGRFKMAGHNSRAHSKYSASGSERWLNCAASVELEEGIESKDSIWSLEGTEAHEVLETLFKINELKSFKDYRKIVFGSADPMIKNAMKMLRKVYEVKKTLVDAELQVEVRVYNSEISEEMFGTVDAALIELYGTLHVFDYKYGTGHVVNPKENTQMIQYALGLAEKYDWQFNDVVVHICQPRAGGKTGHKEWHLTIDQLKNYRELWRKGVKRVEKGGNKPFPGQWCFFCKAKTICPAKTSKQKEKIINRFLEEPLESEAENGFQEESEESFKAGKAGFEKENRKKGSKEKRVKKVDWSERPKSKIESLYFEDEDLESEWFETEELFV